MSAKITRRAGSLGSLIVCGWGERVSRTLKIIISCKRTGDKKYTEGNVLLSYGIRFRTPNDIGKTVWTLKAKLQKLRELQVHSTMLTLQLVVCVSHTLISVLWYHCGVTGLRLITPRRETRYGPSNSDGRSPRGDQIYK